MATILDTIAAFAAERVKADSEKVSRETMHGLAQSMGRGAGDAFLQALAKQEMSFICEVKKASPSKGVISQDFPYLQIAKDYERAGADAVSCLTEPKWFLGSDEIFTGIRQTISTPMIRKDFVVDEYQIDQARVMGANAVLLICALHGKKQIAEWL